MPSRGILHGDGAWLNAAERDACHSALVTSLAAAHPPFKASSGVPDNGPGTVVFTSAVAEAEANDVMAAGTPLYCIHFGWEHREYEQCERVQTDYLNAANLTETQVRGGCGTIAPDPN